jgi:type IV secretion system protein VirB8
MAMKGSAGEEAIEAYLRESSAWDQDRLASLHQAVRRAWQVAGVAGLCTTACALALIVLIPLKRTEPFVIRVDSSTGVVDSVPLYSARMPQDQSVTRYFLTHYVSVCQRFNYVTAESDYEECGAFHSARRNQAWAALWSRNNPQSPLNLYRDGTDVSVRIESVSFLQRAVGVNDLAQVRYMTVKHAAGSAQASISHWIATLQYGYAAPSQDPAVRRWNPLGFKILEFVAEPEVGRDSVGGVDASGATGTGTGSPGEPGVQ